MISAMLAYVRVVDALNHRLGRITMYGIFVMMGVLLWSSVSKTFFKPSLWTLEMAQFSMVAYYMIGGPYAIQMGANVRMDLFYGNWSVQRKALVDSITVFFLIFYLGVLFYGSIGSTAYSFGYWGDTPFAFLAGLVTGQEEVGHLERASTSWRPYIWPVKMIMVVGIFLMLLQAVSELFKDIARLAGRDVPEAAA